MRQPREAIRRRCQHLQRLVVPDETGVWHAVRRAATLRCQHDVTAVLAPIQAGSSSDRHIDSRFRPRCDRDTVSAEGCRRIGSEIADRGVVRQALGPCRNGRHM